MNTYKLNPRNGTKLIVNNSSEGETIEMKIERITTMREPIKDGATLLYTDKKDGVLASTNIRTDRFEVALDGISKLQKSSQAKREGKVIDIKSNRESEASSTDTTT